MPISLIGHGRQIEYINKSRSRGNLSHAYLFHGPEHVGKRAVATALAQSFFCPETKRNDMRSVCGVCHSCRAITYRNYSRVIFLDTAHTLVSKKEIRKEIPIEDIRELKRIFSFAPEGEMWRLAIIDEADKMSEEAGNALLKLFEEPGEQTLIILISPAREMMMPTIISRTQTLGFFTVPEHELASYIEERVPSSQHHAFLSLAAGRPGILMRLCEDSAYAQEEQAFADEISKTVNARDILSAFRISEKISPDLQLRQKAVWYVIKDLQNKLARAAPDEALDAIVKKIKRIDRIAMLMDTTNVNPRLGMDVIFLESMGK